MIVEHIVALTITAGVPFSGAPLLEAEPVSARAPVDSSSNVPASPPTTPSESAALPRFRGTGLFIAAGSVTATALAMSALAAADDCHHYEECFTMSPAISAFAAGPNLIAIGLAAGGGVLRGRSDAIAGTPRNTTAFIISGALLTAAGVAGAIGMHYLNWYSVEAGGLDEGQARCSDTDPDCAEPWFRGTALGAYGFGALAVGGAGLLTYGLSYRNTRVSELSLAPLPMRSGGGVSLAMRW